MDATRSTDKPLPAWLASKIRKAAAYTALSWGFYFAVAAALFIGVALMLMFGNPESKAAPLFWMAVFLVVMYFFGQEVRNALGDFFHPERSEEAAYLRRFGSIEETVRRIELELQDPGTLNYRREVTLTKNWLIITRGSRFAARPLDDLVWAFLRKTTTRLNWVVPIWRTNSVVFRSSGPEAEATCSTEWGTKLIERAAGRCPWLVLGYSEEEDKLWESDRAAFIAAVEERKKQGI